MNFIINLEIKEMFKSTALILLYIVFVSIGVLMIIRWYVNQKLIKNLTIVWIGNFLGSVFTAYLGYYAGIFNSPIIQKVFLDTGISKISLSFSQCVASGFFCNVLVIMGIIMSMSANDVTGKIFGCWFPIMLFVVCGYQHVVANMFIIAVGKIFSPETFQLGEIFINHFLPTSIGNFLSGGVFLPAFLYFSYYKK